MAQIDGSDRGVPPIDTSGSLEVTGVSVDVRAKSAEAARYGGWRQAQRNAWQMLWSKYHSGGRAPTLPDGTLDSIVGGIVVEDEQIGPNRYIARLGVLFDRARAGQLLGVSGGVARSLPLLVIPVQWSGGRPESFEHRTEWQQAWARFRAGQGSIDYVRPSGTGADPLLLNVAQAERRNRAWWRVILDQFGAADVLIPKVRIERHWPGGPVTGHFTAAYGPDSKELTRFTLRVQSASQMPRMLDEGVRRMDLAYSQAQAEGRLRPDASLIIEEPVEAQELDLEESALEATPLTEDLANVAGAGNFTIQFDTPDVAAVTRTEAAVRGVPGVRSVSTSSLALGGISVMYVNFTGDISALRTALSARGWQVQEGGGILRIRRAPTAPTSTPAQPVPAPQPGGNATGG